jgi:hypothetical protein
MNDEPCTQEERDAVIKSARFRVDYILWLAHYLELTDDRLIRKDAARQLRQLVSEE